MAPHICLVLSLLIGTTLSSAAGAGAQTATTGRMLAHPVVRGAAGPFAHVTVTLSRHPDGGAGSFDGIVQTPDGRRLSLAGPDEPADLFLSEPKAVMFAPIGGSRGNAVLILYDSSQIGPQHGTDHRVLVYRIGTAGAVRQLAVEAKLEGAANAAAVRARLAGRRR